jgi:hypothetical protein
VPQGRTTVNVRTAPKRWGKSTNFPRLTYLGPAIAIDTDAARAGLIIDRIRARCPELTRADLLLVARVISERAKVSPAAPLSAGPSKRRRRL